MLPAPLFAPGDPMTAVLPDRAVEAPKSSRRRGRGVRLDLGLGGRRGLWVSGGIRGRGLVVVEVVPWSVPPESSAALAVLSSTKEQKIVRNSEQSRDRGCRAS